MKISPYLQWHLAIRDVSKISLESVYYIIIFFYNLNVFFIGTQLFRFCILPHFHYTSCWVRAIFSAELLRQMSHVPIKNYLMCEFFCGLFFVNTL